MKKEVDPDTIPATRYQYATMDNLWVMIVFISSLMLSVMFALASAYFIGLYV